MIGTCVLCGGRGDRRWIPHRPWLWRWGVLASPPSQAAWEKGPSLSLHLLPPSCITDTHPAAPAPPGPATCSPEHLCSRVSLCYNSGQGYSTSFCRGLTCEAEFPWCPSAQFGTDQTNASPLSYGDTVTSSLLMGRSWSEAGREGPGLPSPHGPHGPGPAVPLSLGP